MPLKDKVVIVSGASRGIGRAIVQALSAAGAIVFGVARSAPETCSFPSRYRYLQVDIRSSEQVQRAISAILATTSRIDVLVNNAGIEHFLPLEKTDESQFDETVQTNLRGAFLLTRAVLPAFRAQGAGHLLFINSVSGLRGFAHDSVYCASKWGLAGFADALEEELRPTGVRVTSLFPGATDTDLPSASWSPKSDPRRHFFLSPDDVARAALFALDQPAHVAISRIVLRPMIEPPYSDFLPIPPASNISPESPGPSAE
jgi:3-oxoacyl-[acyl-carrier protein] reductase